MAVPADQPEGGSAAKGRQKAPQGAGREAVAQGGQDAAETTQPRAAMPQSTAPAAPSAARPSIRMGAAYAGTVIALLAGIGGLISQVLAHHSSQSGATFLFNLAIFAVPVVTAVIALTQIHRLVIIGFLQGMSWQAAPSLAANIVTVAHLSSATGRGLAVALLGVTSYALEVIAAILLMVAWSPAADERRAPRIGVLPVMLLAAVGLSQIAALIFYVTVGGEIVSYSSVAVPLHTGQRRSPRRASCYLVRHSPPDTRPRRRAGSGLDHHRSADAGAIYDRVASWRPPLLERSRLRAAGGGRRARGLVHARTVGLVGSLCFPGAGQNCNVF